MHRLCLFKTPSWRFFSFSLRLFFFPSLSCAFLAVYFLRFTTCGISGNLSKWEGLMDGFDGGWFKTLLAKWEKLNKHLMGPVVILLVFFLLVPDSNRFDCGSMYATHQSFYKCILNRPPLPCAFTDIFLHQRWLIFDLCIALKRSTRQRTENNPTRFSFPSSFSLFTFYRNSTVPNSKSLDESPECSTHSCHAHIIQMTRRQW